MGCCNFVGDLRRIGFTANFEHCHNNGGYCVRPTCPPSARLEGSCFPESSPCCKYMK
ncbi:beta-defensin 2-like [Mastomys coucha]|uniref:beta-defensin 2-like n=1 Tax=Mastomys coucha TaxID=35658 RepID=UPI0012614E2A|nr:beta-defensin 2-like [Mastomys coucha]